MGGNAHLLWIYDGASVTLEDKAVLQNNDFSGSQFNGAAVNLGNGGTLTMKNGAAIQNNTAVGDGTYGGGGGAIFINSGAVFEMQGGTVSGNYAAMTGGAINNRGTFRMTGGTISGNEAAQGGGGIIDYDATVELSGGTITGNVSGTSGAGIYTYGSGVSLSKAPVITQNTDVSGNASNLCLADGQTVTIAGTLEKNASAGITLATGTGVFSSGWATYMNDADPQDYLISDSKDYRIGTNASGELEMTAVPASVEAGPFMVTGGLEGADFTYSETNQELKIDTTTPLTIAMKPGVSTTDSTIRISTQKGAANITLDSVNIAVTDKWRPFVVEESDNPCTLRLTGTTTLKNNYQYGYALCYSNRSLTITSKNGGVLNASNVSTGSSAIQAEKGTDLTIDGSAIVNVTSENHIAINNCGLITIKGNAKVTAAASEEKAAIMSGSNTGAYKDTNGIVIGENAKVTITKGKYGLYPYGLATTVIDGNAVVDISGLDNYAIYNYASGISIGGNAQIIIHDTNGGGIWGNKDKITFKDQAKIDIATDGQYGVFAQTGVGIDIQDQAKVKVQGATTSGIHCTQPVLISGQADVEITAAKAFDSNGFTVSPAAEKFYMVASGDDAISADIKYYGTETEGLKAQTKYFHAQISDHGYQPSLALAVSPDGETSYGNDVVLKATISGTDTLTGKNVKFYNGTTLLETVATNKDGVATLTLTKPNVADYQFQAVFEGDANHTAAQSSVINYTIKKASPTVTFPTAGAITYGATLSETELTGGSGDGSFAWADDQVIPTVNNSGYEMIFTPKDASNYDYSKIEGYDPDTGLIHRTIHVTVNPANPDYTIPDNLKAVYGQTLAEVSLPEGFTWQDALTTSVGNAGGNTFKVTYAPSDQVNYNTITDIEVTITVEPKAPELTTLPTASRVMRGQLLSTSVLSDGVATGLDGAVLEGTWTWKNDREMNEAGTFEETALFTPADANFKAIEVSGISVTVYLPSSSGGGPLLRYTVTFDTQGGSKISSTTVNHNATVDEPEAPTKEGYTFDGWYTDKDCTEPYDFDTKVTQNITLYAKWIEEGPTEPPIDPEEWENPFTDV